MNVARVYDLTGRKVPQLLTVMIMPGFGIQHDGQHLEGGPHTLPADIAYSIVSTSRGYFVEAVAPVTEPIEQRDPKPDNRDPASGPAAAPNTARGARR